MDRAAIFVDAGYFFAAGSVAITGNKLQRKDLSLNIPEMVAKLSEFAKQITGLPLLRIYWYDGAMPKGPSAEHLALGQSDHLKLRLGMINSVGQQKGVDSLIVTDLIDLARNRAISDAILISGDADTRVGVEVAQTFGVRVHLFGISPKHQSQSSFLLQAADTSSEMNAAFLSTFLTINAAAPPPTVVRTPAPVVTSALTQEVQSIASAPTPQANTQQAPVLQDTETIFRQVVDGLLSPLGATEKANLQAAVASGPGVPHEYDGRLLARSRDAIRRELTSSEKRKIRSTFLTSVRAIP